MISEKRAVDEECQRDQWMNALARVTTVGELKKLYGKKYYAEIMYYIHRGDFVAIKSGGVWLVSLDSVVEFWGKPKRIA